MTQRKIIFFLSNPLLIVTILLFHSCSRFYSGTEFSKAKLDTNWDIYMGGKSRKGTYDNDYLRWDTLASDVLVIDKVLFLNLITFYIF